MLELSDFIKSLNLQKNIKYSETEYIINEVFYITIEISGNVFFVNKNKIYTKDKYIYIDTIDKLRKLYLNNIDNYLEILLRRFKIDKIKNRCLFNS